MKKGTRGLVIKADDERRFLLTVAYPAYKPDVAVAADGHLDVASDRVVEEACWRYLRKGARVGIGHMKGFEKAAEVVENYIYRGPTWVIKAPNGTEQRIEAGDWLVGMILAPETWALYKSNKIGGVSVQGGARRSTPTQDTLDRVRRRLNVE